MLVVGNAAKTFVMPSGSNSEINSDFQTNSCLL